MSTYTDSDLIDAGYSYQELINANISPPFPDDSVYIQRRNRMVFNAPLNRNEKINPYTTTNFTKEQLDMRRKIEILKYNSASNNSKLTKREKLAQLIRGNYNTNKMSIPNDAFVPMSSRTAGIPGPPIQFELNPEVPLYMLNTETLPSGTATETSTPTPEWSVIVDPNVFCIPSLFNNITRISTLFIRPTIKSPYYTYRYTTPASINVKGIYLPLDTSGCTITVNIDTIIVGAYYNETLVNNNTTSTSSLTQKTLTFKLQPTGLDTDNITVETYNSELFLALGDLVVENLFLYTAPNFVYTFRITYNVRFTITEYTGSTSTSDLLRRLQARLICNPDETILSNNLPTQSNCVLLTPPTQSVFGNSLTAA